MTRHVKMLVMTTNKLDHPPGTGLTASNTDCIVTWLLLLLLLLVPRIVCRHIRKAAGAANTKLGPGPLIVKPSQPGSTLRERRAQQQAKMQQELAFLKRCQSVLNPDGSQPDPDRMTSAAAAAGADWPPGDLSDQLPACSAPTALGLDLRFEDPSNSMQGIVGSPLLQIKPPDRPTMSEPAGQLGAEAEGADDSGVPLTAAAAVPATAGRRLGFG
jgi:hypothetical protein